MSHDSQQGMFKALRVRAFYMISFLRTSISASQRLTLGLASRINSLKFGNEKSLSMIINHHAVPCWYLICAKTKTYANHMSKQADALPCGLFLFFPLVSSTCKRQSHSENEMTNQVLGIPAYQYAGTPQSGNSKKFAALNSITISQVQQVIHRHSWSYIRNLNNLNNN